MFFTCLAQRSDKHVFFFSTLNARWSKTDILFFFLACWTCGQSIMCWIEFWWRDVLYVPSIAPFAYFCNLVLYIIKKESDRWLNIRWKKRIGEYFMVLWFVQLFIMIVVQFVSGDDFRVPHAMIDTIIGIVIAYAGAMISLVLHYIVHSENIIALLRLYLRNKVASPEKHTRIPKEKARAV